MRDFKRLSLLVACSTAVASAQITVGQGSPNDTIRSAIQRGYFRGNFAKLVSLPPTSTVTPLAGGAGAYVQEFADVTKVSGLTLALIAGPLVPVGGGEFQDNFQMLHPMYDFYTSSAVGAANAGLPLGDTESYNVYAADGFTLTNKFQYQLFARNWGLFAWETAPDSNSVNTRFVLKDPFLTRWKLLGNFAALGGMTVAEAALTSARGTTATVVKFENGYLFNMTTGPSAGRMVSVRAPIAALYVEKGGPAGSLGFPLNDELNVTIGNQPGKRQQFEGGSIEYLPGQTPVIRNAVASIQLSTTGSVRLNLNETFTLRASLSTAAGEFVTDRDVSWTTSNARVVTVQVTLASTNQVTLRAVGGGSAVITATSEGRTSLPFTVFVSAPCCQIGEGAPTTVITQTFLDAVARNRLAVRLPTPNAARRAGAGYIQDVSLTDGRRILITKADNSGQAFIVDRLTDTYEQTGGPTGPLGFPTTDPAVTGRQLFENQTALGGDPPFVVSGSILARWAQLGYDNPGATLGPPVSPAGQFLTFTTVAGRGQIFRNGAVYVAETGFLANRAYYVRGAVAAKYAELGGATGVAGLPTSDEFQIAGRWRQEFEGATMEYGEGDAVAQATMKTRRPVVTVTPQTVVAGNRIRLAVGGFDPGVRLRVSVAGQPDFQVTTESGAYSWEAFVPATARTGSVAVKAVRVGSTPEVAAETSYNIRALSETIFDLRRISGDTQTGAPGALLPAPVRIRLRDELGTPVVNYPVRFGASAGAAIVAPGGGNTVVTNDQGEAEVQVRMPAGEGVALATAEAGRAVTTFSFRVAAQTLTNFPRQAQSPGSFSEQPLGSGPATVGQKGSLVAALSSVLRYYQSRGEMPQPNGPADPGLLNQYLKDYCAIDATNRKICDGFLTAYGGSTDGIINPFRAAAFVGGAADVSIEHPAAVRDLVAAGSPVVLALALSASGNPAGGHFVVAMGITGAGDIEIHDPNPGFNRRTLEAYLNGDGGITGKLTGAFRLLPKSPAAGTFVLVSNTKPAIASNAGSCGPAMEFQERIAVAPVAAAPESSLYFATCDGARQPLELVLAGASGARASFTDLGNPALQLSLTAPADGAVFRASQTNGQWLVSAQSTSFAAAAVLSAASFTPNLAPGGLFSIFGAGLAREGTPTVVEVDGSPATIVFQSPFQLNARMPVETRPGQVTVRVRSPFGQADQTVTVKPVAPAIFELGPKLGAIVNQSGTVNTALTPATRGQAIVAYGTGFGATVLRGQLQATVTPVTATVNGETAQVIFAGLTPGFIGLYQINVVIPGSLAPGTGLPLELVQGEEAVRGLTVSVQ